MNSDYQMEIPRRKRPRPLTHQGIPHAQIGTRPVPEIHTELFRHCYSLPYVQNRPTVISVPGARSLAARRPAAGSS